jgi:hypothetical protein
MNGQSLARLLRLRRLQHDLAGAGVGRAQAQLELARAERERRAELLAGMRLPDRADAAIWLAAVASQRAAVEAVRSSIDLEQAAHQGLDGSLEHWRQTRTAARSLERLTTRMAVLERQEQLRSEQHEQDDRSASRWTPGIALNPEVTP